MGVSGHGNHKLKFKITKSYLINFKHGGIMNTYKIKIVTVIMLISVFLVGCASVEVIKPVANQNERNAIALDSNIKNLIAITDNILPAIVEMSLIDTYRDTMFAIRKSKFKPKQTVKKQIEKEYSDNATLLQNEIDLLDIDLKPIQKEQSFRSYPITSQIAFKEMTPENAAGLWLAIDATYKMALPVSQKFSLRKELIKKLEIVAHQEQAKVDILSAYQKLREKIIQQTTNSKVIAIQLREASQAAKDPNAFLIGVLENNQVIELIGETVANQTNDPKRRAAAEELLSSIKGDAAVAETINAAK